MIIVDREQRRVKFVNDVFQNENNFSYLTKIYDSKDDQYKYHAKIFEIDFEKFNELNSDKNYNIKK